MRKLSEDHKKKLSEALKRNWGISQYRNKQMEAQKGHAAWNKGLNSKPNCIDCGEKLSRYKTLRCRNCWRGVSHPNWKGGYDLKLARNRKRRVFKKGNGGMHTLQEWLELKAFYKNMCLCCKKVEPEVTLSEDHIIPLSKGGSDNIENIQPLCRSCNSRKSAQTINYKEGVRVAYS